MSNNKIANGTFNAIESTPLSERRHGFVFARHRVADAYQGVLEFRDASSGGSHVAVCFMVRDISARNPSHEISIYQYPDPDWDRPVLEAIVHRKEHDPANFDIEVIGPGDGYPDAKWSPLHHEAFKIIHDVIDGIMNWHIIPTEACHPDQRWYIVNLSKEFSRRLSNIYGMSLSDMIATIRLIL